MKWVLYFILIAGLTTVQVRADIVDVLDKDKKFTLQQKEVIYKAYLKGERHNLGYTMAAITIVESSAGKYLVNLSDPSCGVYHALVPSVLSRANMRNTSANRNAICSRLITDEEFAHREALKELLYWESRYVGQRMSWSKMVASYNAGTRYKNGLGYAKKVLKWVKYLQGENR